MRFDVVTLFPELFGPHLSDQFVDEVRMGHGIDVLQLAQVAFIVGGVGLDGGDPAFRALFSKSPVKRIGRDRFVRNVLYAIGNSGQARLAPGLQLLAEGQLIVDAAEVGGAGHRAWRSDRPYLRVRPR